MKGKPLLPTLRTKKRYVVYELISDSKINTKDIYLAIKNSFLKCFGFFGYGNSGIMNTKIFNENNKRGILKVNNKYLDELKLSLAMVTNINNNDVILHTVNVSGILKKAKLFAKGG